MVTTKVVCDQCGADITNAGENGWRRFVLCLESRGYAPGVSRVPLVHLEPAPPLHFCGARCLRAHVLQHTPEGE